MLTIHTITRVRFDLIRAVKIAAKRAEEDGAHQRVSTRKTVRLRWCQIEKGHRTRTFERELESHIQQRRSDHRDREEFRFTP